MGLISSVPPQAQHCWHAEFWAAKTHCEALHRWSLTTVIKATLDPLEKSLVFGKLVTRRTTRVFSVNCQTCAVSTRMTTKSKTQASVNSTTPALKPQYVLRQAQLSDLNSIARVWHRAFFDDEIIGYIMHPYRQKYPKDVYYFLLRGVRERFWDWRHRFFVVVSRDEHGVEKIVGAADWRRLGQGGASIELSKADPR